MINTKLWVIVISGSRGAKAERGERNNEQKAHSFSYVLVIKLGCGYTFLQHLNCFIVKT